MAVDFQLDRAVLEQLLASAPTAIGVLAGPELRWAYVNDEHAAYNSALYGINCVVASGGQERIVSVGSHSKTINCSLSTGATSERAIARYEGDSTIYELSTRARSDCGWTFGRATG